MLPSPIPFVCLSVGDFHHRADLYLNRLHSMLSRHCPHPFTLTCFADLPRRVSPAIELRPCQSLIEKRDEEMHPTLYKLGLFKKDVLPHNEFIYLDMTLVIRKEMTEMLEFAFGAPQDLIINDDWNYDSYNSSVMRIRNGALQTVADAFESGIVYPQSVEGDQDFIQQHVAALGLGDRVAFWPNGQIVSFKKTQRINRVDGAAARRAVEAATIVKFHGKPRMHRFANPFYNIGRPRDALFFKRDLYRNWR